MNKNFLYGIIIIVAITAFSIAWSSSKKNDADRKISIPLSSFRRIKVQPKIDTSSSIKKDLNNIDVNSSIDKDLNALDTEIKTL